MHDDSILADLVRTPEPSPEAAVTAQREGDDFRFSFAAHGITVALSNLRDTGAGIYGEVTVTAPADGGVALARLNLLSSRGQADLTRMLAAAGKSAQALSHAVCYQTVTAFREGEPIVRLIPTAKISEPGPPLMRKVLVKGQPNGVFAPGGEGKSLFANATALAVAAGINLPAGLDVIERGNVLIADWESDRAVHEWNIAALAKGLKVSPPSNVFYLRCSRPLLDDVGRFRRECDQKAIRYLIIDSYGAAAGTSPEGSDYCLPFFNALRSLRSVTKLIVTHTTKAQADQPTGRSRPYGSVYFENECRCVWEIRKTEDIGTDTLTIGAFHRKQNVGRLHPPFGLRFTFQDDAILLTGHDVGTSPDLLARTSLSWQLGEALKRGAQTTEELAEATQTDTDAVRKALHRMKVAGKVVPLETVALGGRHRHQRWGLRVRP